MQIYSLILFGCNLIIRCSKRIEKIVGEFVPKNTRPWSIKGWIVLHPHHPILIHWMVIYLVNIAIQLGHGLEFNPKLVQMNWPLKNWVLVVFVFLNQIKIIDAALPKPSHFVKMVFII